MSYGFSAFPQSTQRILEYRLRKRLENRARAGRRIINSFGLMHSFTFNQTYRPLTGQPLASRDLDPSELCLHSRRQGQRKALPQPCSLVEKFEGLHRASKLSPHSCLLRSNSIRYLRFLPRDAIPPCLDQRVRTNISPYLKEMPESQIETLKSNC